jgi:hypothetical protein
MEIPASVESIGFSKMMNIFQMLHWPPFSNCTSLREVLFAGDSRLKVIDGFQGCTSLRRVEIPASVEEIKSRSFFGCTALTEVTFARDSRLRVIHGFQGCTSLYRLEIPASVERIDSSEDNARLLRHDIAGLSLRELVLQSGTRPVRRIGTFRAFITFDDEKDMKSFRRRVHQDPI